MACPCNHCGEGSSWHGPAESKLLRRVELALSGHRGLPSFRMTQNSPLDDEVRVCVVYCGM